MLKVYKVSELQPGMLVSKVVSQHGPVKLRKIGMIRSPEMIKGLTEMGVSEVEVDLSQSFGLEDETTSGSGSTEAENNTTTAQTKLTPTQQLLQNERQSAKENNVGSTQYNRSLFMPSMDTLPSIWDLYGKNVAALLVLVVGGVCIGYNVASIPKWVSLFESKDYVVLDYQPTFSQAQRQVNPENMQNGAADSDATSNSDISNSDISINEAASISTSSPASEAVPTEPPLILGYQPENVSSDEAARGSSNVSDNATDPAVSAALLEKINKAIQELDSSPDDQINTLQSNTYDDLPRIDQLSIALQTQIPTMAFSAHMYSSNRDGRWVRVNGRRLVEGDYIADGLQLVNIEPQTVILSFKNEVFTMSALTDW